MRDDVVRYEESDRRLDDYILAHIDPEPDELARLHRLTNLRLTYPQMCCGHLQGQLLAMLCRMIGARRIVELGTFSGYATIAMAQALPPDGVVDTIETFDELEDFLTEVFDCSACRSKIRLHMGDALDILPTLVGQPYDLCYIDADKRRYADFYRAALPLVRPGGLIVADNTLWNGKVVDDIVKASDTQTQGVRAFNDLVAADASVEKVILPMRDGLTIVRKKESTAT